MLRPALQRWKTFGSHLFRNGPDVRQFPINRTPEELSKRNRRTRTHLELAFADKPQIIELTINVGLGANAWVEGRA